MRFLPSSAFDDLYWYSFNDEPIAFAPHFRSMKLSDPSFLLPDEAPDSLWHLYVHTWRGIEHLTSTSGINWHREHLQFPLARSPFIYREGVTYYMVYEASKSMPWKKGGRGEGSRIMLSSSTDLALWSEPRTILSASDIPQSSWRGGKPRVSRPQLLQWGGKYRLYFGSGDAYMYDSHQKTAAMLMYAESSYIEGPYEAIDKPVMIADPESEYSSLATGSVRIIPCSDSIAAVICSRYYDKERKASRSVMRLSLSKDGLSFPTGSIMQCSPDSGWASGYMTACDLRYKENEETWYCYYSADGYPNQHIPIRTESIGLLLGKER